MFARQLEALLRDEAAKTHVSMRSPDDIHLRFESLRGYRLLPAGRGKNAKELSLVEIVAGFLSLATARPDFAGLAATILAGLRPVGAAEIAFEKCASFGHAMEALIDNPAAREKLIAVRVSDSEMYTNAYGRASIEFYANGVPAITHYVGKTAVSLLRPGAERTFDPTDINSSVVAETVFTPYFFKRLYREIQRKLPPPPPDPEEEDHETKKEEREKRLGLMQGSTFLNMGVDNQVTWPSVETVVDFEGHKLVLLPMTRDHATSIHIDLYRSRLTPEAASTLINRFLSLLAWCDDHYAVLQEGWSGNPVPVAVPRRDLAFTTATTWLFDRKIPQSPEARKALALYREGRNAEQNFLVGYAVLSFYKIIELKYKGKSEARTWFRNNFEKLRSDKSLADRVSRFEIACGTEKPHDHLYRACRTAVAHANKPFSSDPDEYDELQRLHVAADILQALARVFIIEELGVSESSYDGS